MTMKPADSNQVLQALSEGPEEGVSLMALARRTGKTLPELSCKSSCRHNLSALLTRVRLNTSSIPIHPFMGSWKVHSFIWRYSTQKCDSNKYAGG